MALENFNKTGKMLEYNPLGANPWEVLTAGRGWGGCWWVCNPPSAPCATAKGGGRGDRAGGITLPLFAFMKNVLVSTLAQTARSFKSSASAPLLVRSPKTFLQEHSWLSPPQGLTPTGPRFTSPEGTEGNTNRQTLTWLHFGCHLF